MAKLTAMPRTRRLRTATSIGLVLAMIGATLVAGAVRAEPVLHPVMMVALVITGVGVAAVLWGRGGHPAATQAEQSALAQQGRWDNLPSGSYEDNGRIGLPSLTVWTKVLIPVAAVLMLAAGGLIVLASEGDREMFLGGCFVMALGALMFVAQTLSAGTVYWLGPDGISRERWPRWCLDWADIVSVGHHRQNIVLRSVRRSGSRSSGRKTITIATGVLEISPVQLTRLIEALRAHVVETEDEGRPVPRRRPGPGGSG